MLHFQTVVSCLLVSYLLAVDLITYPTLLGSARRRRTYVHSTCRLFERIQAARYSSYPELKFGFPYAAEQVIRKRQAKAEWS